jgi:hypothetical protein
MELHEIVNQEDTMDAYDGVVKNALIRGQKYDRRLWVNDDPEEFFVRVKSVFNESIGKYKDTENTNNLPDVICQCGCDAFTLNYGCYRIIATCINCKKYQSVYSG